MSKVIDVILSKKWLKCLVIILGTILLSFTVYMLINGGMKGPDVEIYQPSATTSQVNQIAATVRQYSNNRDFTWLVILGWVLFALTIISAVILTALKKMNFKLALVYVFGIAILVRLIYVNFTDNIFTRQYDVWNSTYYGHFGITAYIYKHWSIPGLLNNSLEQSYQLYHPKFSHIANALVMKINSTFLGNNTYVLYESVRIFTCSMSIGIVFITYYTLKEIFNKPLPVLVGTFFVGVSPLLIRFSASSNNDGMLYFFMWLSIYFSVKFFKARGWKNYIIPLIGIAISVGGAMGSKLSGAIIAIPIGILMIYKVITDVINEKDSKSRLKLLGIFAGFYVVFLIIVAPIGFAFPIYNFVKYKQPLTYVWHNLNKGLLVPENYSYNERYLFFSFKTYFNSMFMQLWSSSAANGVVDYNIYSSLAKSFIFGEFSYQGNVLIVAAILYGINLVVVFGLFFLGIYFIVSRFINRNYDIPVLLLLPLLTYYAVVFFKKKDVDLTIFGVVTVIAIVLLLYYVVTHWKTISQRKALLFFEIVFLAFAISYFTFQLTYPYTCTQDSRYVGMFLIVGAFAFGALTDKYENNKPALYVGLSILGIYAFSSVGMYLSLI